MSSVVDQARTLLVGDSVPRHPTGLYKCLSINAYTEYRSCVLSNTPCQSRLQFKLRPKLDSRPHCQVELSAWTVRANCQARQDCWTDCQVDMDSRTRRLHSRVKLLGRSRWPHRTGESDRRVTRGTSSCIPCCKCRIRVLIVITVKQPHELPDFSPRSRGTRRKSHLQNFTQCRTLPELMLQKTVLYKVLTKPIPILSTPCHKLVDAQSIELCLIWSSLSVPDHLTSVLYSCLAVYHHRLGGRSHLALRHTAGTSHQAE